MRPMMKMALCLVDAECSTSGDRPDSLIPDPTHAAGFTSKRTSCGRTLNFAISPRKRPASIWTRTQKNLTRTRSLLEKTLRYMMQMRETTPWPYTMRTRSPMPVRQSRTEPPRQLSSRCPTRMPRVSNCSYLQSRIPLPLLRCLSQLESRSASTRRGLRPVAPLQLKSAPRG